jgi:glycosyltransferase involved in cell wall biosynthesis
MKNIEFQEYPLKLLFLEPQPCIRALKYAIGLRYYLGRRIRIHFYHMGHSLSELYGFGEEYFDKVMKVNSRNLHEYIDEYGPHIIHSHNAPDKLTLRAIDAAEGIPVIHDVHEVLSVHRSGFFKHDNEGKLAEYRKEERNACEKSDGRIYATEQIKKYITLHYDIDGEEDLVFYNYALESMMPYFFKEKLSSRDNQIHIVYVGCLTSIVKDNHYDLRNIFSQIAAQGFHIHFYPASDEITESNKTYQRVAENSQFMHYHSPMEYERLLYEMTQYDFGWAGFNDAKNGRHLDIAIQNKVFDYISSGLPILSYPYKAMQSLIKKNGIGLIINNVNELANALRTVDIEGLRARVMQARHRLTVESHISNLLEFYTKIVESRCN